MAQNHQEPIKSEDLSKILEPLIRRVVREELTRISQRQSNIFSLNPGMPIYKDMQELKNKKAKGKIKLHAHEEVWCE